MKDKPIPEQVKSQEDVEELLKPKKSDKDYGDYFKKIGGK